MPEKEFSVKIVKQGVQEVEEIVDCEEKPFEIGGYYFDNEWMGGDSIG